VLGSLRKLDNSLSALEKEVQRDNSFHDAFQNIHAKKTALESNIIKSVFTQGREHIRQLMEKARQEIGDPDLSVKFKIEITKDYREIMEYFKQTLEMMAKSDQHLHTREFQDFERAFSNASHIMQMEHTQLLLEQHGSPRIHETDASIHELGEELRKEPPPPVPPFPDELLNVHETDASTHELGEEFREDEPPPVPPFPDLDEEDAAPPPPPRDDEFDEDENNPPPLPERDEDAAPAAAPVPNAPPLDHHFFAHNQAEYTAKREQVINVQNNFNMREGIAWRTKLAVDNLATTASTREIRDRVNTSINTQLEDLQAYKGFLKDKLRMLHNPAAADPINPLNVREDAYIAARMQHNLNHQAELNGRIRRTEDRLVRTNRMIHELQQSKAALTTLLENGAPQIAYYHKYFDVNAGVKFDTQDAAVAAAIQFRDTHPAYVKSRHYNLSHAAGDAERATEKYAYRFYPTEFEHRGKIIPAAIIQETNASETYSKQTAMVPAHKLKR
jgi:hypothetical protein